LGNKIFISPFFYVGLLLKISLASYFSSSLITDLYVPFLSSSIENFSFDPWSSWMLNGGNPDAFPYGFVMWVVFLPLIFLFDFIGISIETGYIVTLLLFDLGLLFIFCRLNPKKDTILIWLYWLSPIVILGIYVYGINDIIPVFFLVLSLLSIKNRNFTFSGVFFIMAVSAKLSMLLALPFFFIYLYSSKPIRKMLPNFLKGLFWGMLVFILTFFFSDFGYLMIRNNPELPKIFGFSLQLNEMLAVYIVPIIYLLMLYAAWRIKRMNYLIFEAILGLSFFLVVLPTPVSPGWILWSLPVLISYQVNYGRKAIVITSIFTFFYILTNISGDLELSKVTEKFFGSSQLLSIINLNSLLFSISFAFGLILAQRLWRETVNDNDYFRLSRKPFLIGITGNLLSGKEKIAGSISGLLGENSVVKLPGKNYLIQDTKKPIAKFITQYNPMSNDLESYANDILSLSSGKSIHSKSPEKSSKGREVLKSNDFIITYGIHTLVMPIIRSSINLSIFIEVCDSLKKFFQNSELLDEKNYKSDYKRYVESQKSLADIVLTISPVNKSLSSKSTEESKPKMELRVKTSNTLKILSLQRVLVGVCGLHVNVENLSENNQVELYIEGEVSEQDIALATKILCPRAIEFLDIEPKWNNGVEGLIQLIVMTNIDQALAERFL